MSRLLSNTQPPISCLAFLVIRSIIQPNAHDPSICSIVLASQSCKSLLKNSTRSTCSTHNRRLPGVRDSSEPRRANASAELNTFRVFCVFRGSNLCALCQNMRCEPSWRVFGDRCKAALFRVFSDESHLQHAVVKEECSRAKWQGCPHILKAA